MLLSFMLMHSALQLCMHFPHDVHELLSIFNLNTEYFENMDSIPPTGQMVLQKIRPYYFIANSA
jgi:hypothetical protein